jgi:hypothetical protein
VVVVGGTVVVVVVVVVGGRAVVVGGRVVVVGGGVVVVVLRIGVGGGWALAGDVATGGLLTAASSALVGTDEIGVCDDVLPRPNGGDVVTVLPTTFVVVVVLVATAVGLVVVPFTCWTESVRGGVSVLAKAKAKTHTAPLTASTATTSATPGYHTPSR